VPPLAAVVIPVRLDLSSVGAQTQAQLNNAFRHVTPTVEEAAKKHGSRFGTVFGGGVGETINSKLSPALAGVGDQFGEFAGAAMGPLGAVTAGVGLLAGQAVNMGVRTAASMEQAQIGFQTLLGSEQKAQVFLADLQQFAAKTPFELPGLIEASRTLLGVGLNANQTKAALLAFGNASSAVGVGQENFQRVMVAVSQSIGTGRFQTEELNQVTENGIPIWTILSRAMGKPVPELRNLASHGRLLTKDVLPLLERQMNKDYGGAMERQSRSLSGVWSTFMDTLNIGMANVMQPLIPLMTTGLTAATNVFAGALSAIPRAFSNTTAAGQQFTNLIRGIARWVTGDLVPAFQAVAARVLPQVQTAMASVGRAFSEHQDVIQALGAVLQGVGWVITRILIPVLGDLVIIVVQQVAGAIRILLSIAGAVVTAIQAMNNFGSAVNSGVTSAVTTATSAMDRFGTAINNGARNAATGATSAMDRFGSAINDGVRNAVTGAIRSMSSFGASINNAVLGGLRSAGSWLVGVGSAILNGLITGWNTVFPHLVIAAGHTRDGIMIAFRAAPGWLLGVGRTLLNGLINGFYSMFGPWSGAVRGFVDRQVIAPMAGAVRAWLPAGRNFVVGLLNGTRAMFGTVASTISSFINRWLIAPFSRAIAWLQGPARNYILGLLNGARSMFATVAATVSGFITRYLTNPFRSAIGWLQGPARNYIAGLLNGARSMFNTVSATVSGFINQRLIGPFRSAIGWLVGSGRNIISGLISGMNAIGRTINSWVQSHIISPITGAFRGAFNFIFNGGYNIIRGLYSGITSALGNVRNWVSSHITTPIINGVKYFFGISSPSRVMAGIGGNLISGLIQGLVRNNPTQFIGKIFGGMPQALGAIVNKGLVAIQDLPGKAISALGGLAGKIGGLVGGLFSGGGGGGTSYGRGVSQWSTVVLQALAMLGQPASWLGTVLNRMQRESGGNPRAINLWDINAQRGDPSKGLMQTISGTFNAYAGPLRGRGIYDPLANVYAGLNYALHRYGSLAALNRPGGYDAGGWLPPGGVGMNLTSRPERVLDPQASEAYTGGGGGGAGNVRVTVLLDGQVIDDRVHIIVEDAVGELGARIDNGIGG
jgi:tape measure domain-containing protein